MDVFKPVIIVSGSSQREADTLTFAVADDPQEGDERIVDSEGTCLAKPIFEPRLGWNITPAGATRIEAESRKLISFARPS